MSDGPTYEQFASPELAGLGDYAKAQVVQAINVQLLTEIVDQAGGEVVLPPGFRDRIGEPKSVVMTRFLDDGSYRVWTEPLTPEYHHPGLGTRWERMEGPRKREQRPQLYEVGGRGGGMVTLVPITEAGEPIDSRPSVSVSEDYLRRGVAGWRHWRPPHEIIEATAGRDL